MKPIKSASVYCRSNNNCTHFNRGEVLHLFRPLQGKVQYALGGTGGCSSMAMIHWHFDQFTIYITI